MPPCLDIYIATADRSTACIEGFLEKYADLSTDRLRQEYEVYMPNILDNVATGTLPATLGYGTADPNRRFALYFTSKQLPYTHVMVYSGHLGRLLLGLSIEHVSETGESNHELAEAVMDQLCAEYDTQMGAYGFEMGPAEAEERMASLLQ